MTDALANAPNPIWRMTGAGTLVWRNPALASVSEDPATDFGAVLRPDPPAPGEKREIRVCLPGDDSGTTRLVRRHGHAPADG